jgi:fumarate reductase subunit D
MARSNEPFWWAFFLAGGVVAAIFMPITIFITSIAAYTGLIHTGRLWEVMHNPGTRVYLGFLIALSLFHWAHRFRFTLVDVGLKAAHSLIAVLCYGTAVAGTIAAIVLLATM